MVAPLSATLLAEINDQPWVSSVELTVGAGPGVWVGPAVGVGPTGVGVGVFVFGALGLLALAEPPMELSRNTSTSAAVKKMDRRFGFCMEISFPSSALDDRL